MTARVKFFRLTKNTRRKLAERSAVLYGRALSRWNTRTPLIK